MELTAQKGKGDMGKRTSDRARTLDLRSIAEFQPHEPWRPVKILHHPLLRREKATGEKGPATALKLRIYALSQSFSHASHGDHAVEILRPPLLLCTGLFPSEL